MIRVVGTAVIVPVAQAWIGHADHGNSAIRAVPDLHSKTVVAPAVHAAIAILDRNPDEAPRQKCPHRNLCQRWTSNSALMSKASIRSPGKSK